MTRAKVLIAVTNADLAGAPIHVRTLVSRLNQDFDIVVVFGEDGPVREAIKDMGLPTFVIPNMRSQVNPIADMLCLWAFLRVIKSERPVLIHAHSSKAGMIARLAAKLLRIPCIYTAHGWGFGIGRPKIQSVLVYVVERLFSVLPESHYVFISDADRIVGERRLKLNPDRCVTIHNGVPDHGYRADVAISTSAIMVARVCHAKHHELLLLGFARCSGKLELFLIGDGTNTQAFRAKVNAIATTKAHLVHCIGVSDAIPQLLARAGIFVLCSRYEGLPLSIIEAMCAGLPVIASDVGGIPELVEDEVNGFLIAGNSVDLLASRLDTLANDDAMRVRMGNASRTRYESIFSAERMSSAVGDFYRAVLSGKHT